MTEFDKKAQGADQSINIEIRSEILKYSLHLENAINSLLLAYLGIIDKSSTKLFGNKAGISFKSKIDLLYDIDVLSKREHAALELQMNFRNKFIHDIECNSFLAVLNMFDNGIKNRFKKYLKNDGEINNEESCKKACRELFISNMDVAIKKVELKMQFVEDKRELIQSLINKEVRIIDLSFNFIHELLSKLKTVDFENTQIKNLATFIYSECENYSSNLKTDGRIIKLNERLEKLFAQDKIFDYLK